MAQSAETGRVMSLSEWTDVSMGVIYGVGGLIVLPLMGVAAQHTANKDIESANSVNLQTSAGVEIHDVYMKDASAAQTVSNISFILFPASLALAVISARALRASSRRNL